MVMLRKMAASNYSLKVSSFILGCCCWYFLSSLHTIDMEYSVPVSFYESKKIYTFDTVETITIWLRGYKTDFYTLDFKNLAFHINADTLQNGENVIRITEENLFLPPSIKLVNCNPSYIVVRANSL